MHLVIDDQSPIMPGDQSEVRKLLAITWAISEYLVGRHGDGPDLFAVAGILADLRRSQACFIEQFGDPLAHRDGVWREDQRRALHGGHRADSHDRLSGATRQDDDATAAAHTATGVERGHRVALVFAEREGVALLVALAHRHSQGIAFEE